MTSDLITIAFGLGLDPRITYVKELMKPYYHLYFTENMFLRTERNRLLELTNGKGEDKNEGKERFLMSNTDCLLHKFARSYLCKEEPFSC